MTTSMIFSNTRAANFTCSPVKELQAIQKFHKSLPNFGVTPLLSINNDVRYGRLFLKDESNRAGLPSFKILGASWGAFRAVVNALGLPIDTGLDVVAQKAQDDKLILHAATDGNHGRAVARMASIMGIPAVIYVPVNFVEESTVQAIRNEGATIYASQKDYDAMVIEAYTNFKEDQTFKIVFVQDTSFLGYEEIPTWIVDGYSTMLAEIENQLASLGLKASHIITPVGVGSLAHAVVLHCKSAGRQITVITVEPETAACLNHALNTNKPTPIKTGRTMMEGMNCGTVSDISWPFLRRGVDASLTVTEHECHRAIQQMFDQSVNTGPCGAATYAAFTKLIESMSERIRIDQDSIVVMLATEGPRTYSVPI